MHGKKHGLSQPRPFVKISDLRRHIEIPKPHPRRSPNAPISCRPSCPPCEDTDTHAGRHGAAIVQRGAHEAAPQMVVHMLASFRRQQMTGPLPVSKIRLLGILLFRIRHLLIPSELRRWLEISGFMIREFGHTQNTMHPEFSKGPRHRAPVLRGHLVQARCQRLRQLP